MIKVHETVREDGFRIISARIEGSKKVRLTLQVPVGSAYDPPQQRGLHHYFEHMAFKGTETRTVEQLNSFKRRNVLYWNASTDRLHTQYEGEAVSHKFVYLCELLCDMFFRSVFPQEELDREKEVILNEIARDKDDDGLTVYNCLREQLYAQNPLRIFGVGTPEGVASISRDDLLVAHRKWYVPAYTTAFVVGDIDHAVAVDRLTDLVPIGNEVSPLTEPEWDDEYNSPPLQTEVVVERKDREKGFVLMGTKIAFNSNWRENQVSMLHDYMLVRGSSSRLWNEVREKRGLAYSTSGSSVSTLLTQATNT